MYKEGRYGANFWKNEGIRTPDVLTREHALNALSGRNLVITGGTGKIGKVLTEFFSTPGTINTRSISLTPHHDSPANETMHGDLTDPAFAMKALTGADVVIQMAGITSSFLCHQDPEGALRENVEITRNVAEAASNNHTRLAILASGLMANELSGSVSPTAYGMSKYESEHVWRSYAQNSHNQNGNGSGTSFVIARFGSVSEPNHHIGLYDQFALDAARTGKIHIYGIDSNRRVMSIDQVIDLICFMIAEQRIAGNGSTAMRSDMPLVTALNLARDIAEHPEQHGLNERPDIVLTSPHPAVRQKDTLYADGEQDRTIGIGENTILPPHWKEIEPDVHLSYPVHGNTKAVLFEHKIPGVVALDGLRGVTSEKPVGDYPHTLEFCPVAACNFGCPACSYAQRNEGGAEHTNSKPSSMSRDTAFQMLSSIREKSVINRERFAQSYGNDQLLKALGSEGKNPVPGIFIAGWGEPTLSPWLGDFITEAGRDFPVALCTNASMLETMDIATPRVLSNLNLLLWSLYAPDEQSFRELAMSRTPSKNRNFFEAVDHGIKKSLAIRDSEHLDFKFAIKILLNRKNYPMIMQLYDYASSFDPDRLVIRLANNFEPGQDVELTAFDRHVLRRIITDSTTKDPQHPLKRFAQAFLKPEIKPYVPKWGGKCHNISEGQFAMIDPDGNVYQSVVTDGVTRRSIGNVNKELWGNIWGGREHGRQIRLANHEYRNHACGAQDGKCRHADASAATERFLRLAAEDRAPFMPSSYYNNDGPFI